MYIIQYTVNTAKFQCLFRYLFRSTRATLRLKNYVKNSQRLIYVILMKDLDLSLQQNK